MYIYTYMFCTVAAIAIHVTQLWWSVCVCVYVCMCMYVYVSIFLYARNTCITSQFTQHTYIHTYTHIQRCPSTTAIARSACPRTSCRHNVITLVRIHTSAQTDPLANGSTQTGQAGEARLLPLRIMHKSYV
jgi:hypothetical protein